MGPIGTSQKTWDFNRSHLAIEPGSGPGAPHIEPCGFLWEARCCLLKREVSKGSILTELAHCGGVTVGQNPETDSLLLTGIQQSPWCLTMGTCRTYDYLSSLCPIEQRLQFKNGKIVPVFVVGSASRAHGAGWPSNFLLRICFTPSITSPIPLLKR